MGDGLLEFCTAETILGMSTQFFRRVGQAPGPICLRFNRANPYQKAKVAYINVDGEFFQIRNPVSVALTPSAIITEPHINILCRIKPGKTGLLSK